MKRLFKFGSIGLVIAGAIALGGEAGAQIPAAFLQTGGTAIRLGISGTPNTTSVLTFNNPSPQQRSTTIRVNACGFGKFTNPSAFTEGSLNVRVGDAEINSFNVATVKGSTAIVEPTCVNGVAVGIPATGSAFNVGKGSIVVTDLPTSRVMDVSYTTNDVVTRNVNINACGFGITNRISSTSIGINGGSPITQSSLLYGQFSCSSGIASQTQTNNSPATPFPVIPAISKDSLNNLILKAAPSSSIPVELFGQTFTRSVTSDRCGGVYVGSFNAPVSGIVNINGAAINIDALPLRSIPETCRYNAEFRTYGVSQGYGSSRYDDGRAYIIPSGGYGDRAILSVQTLGTRNLNVNTNACGIGVARSPVAAPFTPATSFAIDSAATTTVGSLPSLAAIPRCNATRGLTTVTLP